MAPPEDDAPTLGLADHPRELRRRPSRRPLAAVGVLAVLAAALLVPGLRSTRRAPTPPPSLKVRPSLAVLPFKDLGGRPESAWLQTALSEMLAAELAAGGALRIVPGENVARLRADLGLPPVDSLTAEILAHVHETLGADVVVLGAYVAGADGRVRLDVRVQHGRSGEVVAVVTEEGTQAALVDLVARGGGRLREALGTGGLSTADALGLRASLPASPAALRPLAEGLARLRAFDAAGARERLAIAVAAAPDHPLGHAALAEAWALLGHDDEARAAIQRARELSSDLPRESRLSIEARHCEALHDWPEAVRIYDVLFSFFPDNLEHGLRLAAAQTAAGRADDARGTIALLRRLPAPTPDDPRLDLAEAALAETLADFRGQLVAAGRAVARGQARGERLLVARGRLHEAYAAGRLGRLAQTRAAADEARRIFEAAGDRGGLAWALSRAGSVLLQSGHTLEASRLYAEALALFETIGLRAGEAATASNLHLVRVLRGELQAAAPWLARARAVDAELGNRRGLAIDAGNHALWLHERGELAAARAAQDESIVGLRDLGERGTGAVMQQRAADTLAALGRLDEAESRYRNALGVLRERGTERYVAQALAGLGELLRVRGDLRQARASFDEAQQIRRRIGDQLGEAEGRLAQARLAIDDGRAAEVGGVLEPAIVYFRRERHGDGEALALALQAVAAGSRGAAGASDVTSLAARAAPRAGATEVPRVAACVQLLLARAHRLAGLDPGALLQRAAEAAGRFPGLALEVRLEAALGSGPGTARAQALERLEREGAQREFLLLSRQAAQARRQTNGR